MEPEFKFIAKSRVDLDGTNECVMYTAYPLLFERFGAQGSGPFYLKVESKQARCGAYSVLAPVCSPENRLEIDSLKLKVLGVEDGEEVSVRCITLPEASVLEIRTPAGLSESELDRLRGKCFVQGERTALLLPSGDVKPVQVVAVQPMGIVRVGAATQIKQSPEPARERPIRYSDLGGLDREIQQIRELVEYPLRQPEIFTHMGVKPPRGVILYGPPGTGKTLLARALAAEVGASVFAISGPEVYSKWYGDSEERLRRTFQEAARHAPAVVLVDELDALVPRRDAGHGEVEHRVVNTMLTLMDGLCLLNGVVVVGTTNRIDDIDPALRREGRFSGEIRIRVPDLAGRKQILKLYLAKMPLADDVDLERLAQGTVGFVGADLAALCREAAYCVVRRSCPQEGKESWDRVDAPRVTQADFEAALAQIHPSALREFRVEVPTVTWSQVGGLDSVKQLLVENVAYPITRAEAFRRAGVKPARGILLYGPPGTGKTLLAKAVAHECGANFIAVSGPEVLSKWIGDAESRIRSLFRTAREAAPCVLFFDEIDALAPCRGSEAQGLTDPIVNQILAEMDGIQDAEGMFVLAATNRRNLLDPALVRPGRFDYQVEVPLPDAPSRRAILSVHLQGKPLAAAVDVARLVEETDGLSGADLAGLCRQAGMIALRRAGFQSEAVTITPSDIMAALESIREAGGGHCRPFGFAQSKKEA